jgi:hypothetical protein
MRALLDLCTRLDALAAAGADVAAIAEAAREVGREARRVRPIVELIAERSTAFRYFLTVLDNALASVAPASVPEPATPLSAAENLDDELARGRRLRAMPVRVQIERGNGSALLFRDVGPRQFVIELLGACPMWSASRAPRDELTGRPVVLSICLMADDVAELETAIAMWRGGPALARRILSGELP